MHKIRVSVTNSLLGVNKTHYLMEYGICFHFLRGQETNYHFILLCFILLIDLQGVRSLTVPSTEQSDKMTKRPSQI